MCGWDERMDETHLSVFHSILNRDVMNGVCSLFPSLSFSLSLARALPDYSSPPVHRCN